MHSRSLSKHLFALTLFAAVPLIILSFVVVDRLALAERTAIRENLAANAQALANATRGEIEEVLVVARLLARSRLLLGGNFDEFQKQVAEILPFFHEAELHVSASDGKRLLRLDRSGMKQSEPEMPQALAWDLAQRVLDSNEPAISDVLFDRGEPVVVIHVPVIREGTPKQVLSIRISTARFQKLLAEQSYPADWLSAILDSKGNFIARIPEPERVGMPASPSWQAAIAQSSAGVIENTVLGGDRAVTAYSTAFKSWTAGVAVRKSMLDTPVYRTLWMLASLAALSLIISLLFSWLIGRRLASGVHYLESKAAEMIVGQPIEIMPLGVNEYDRLLRTVAATSALIRERDEQRQTFEASLISSKAFLQAAIAVSDVTVYDWDLQSDRVKSDAAFKRLWGLASGADPTSADLVDLIHSDDRRMVQIGIARSRDPSGDGVFSAEFRILPADGTEMRWITCRSRWSRFVDDKPVSAIGAARDVTQRKLREARLLQQQKVLRDLADAMPQLVWTADPSGLITYFNKKRADYMVKTDASEWKEFIHPDDLAPTEAAWHAALQAVEQYEIEHRLKRADGTYAWHLSRACPLHDADGMLTTWVGTATDIDEHKQREKHIHVLMGEVNHRSKNILTVIQGIARLTSSSTTTLAEFQSKFAARLQGLAGSQDLLVNQDWHGVDLNELAQLQLNHYLGLEGARVRITGPRVFLAAAAAQSIGMALHELSTNAAKYGALKNQEGSVELTWSIESTPEGPELSMAWTEKNGPAVDPPTRRGFGAAVVERMLNDSLGGKVELLFLREGVRWRFRGPLMNLVGESEMRQ